MTQIKKLAWYGSSVAVAALLAVTLMVTASQTAFAASVSTYAFNPATVAAGSSTTLTVTDADIAGGDFVVFSIDPASSATAEFHAGTGNKQSVVCVEGGACDLAGAGAIGVRINTLTTGTLLVRVQVWDGVDGAVGDGDVSNDGTGTTLALTVTPASANITLSASPATINASAPGNETIITATVTSSSGNAVAANTLVTFTTTSGSFGAASGFSGCVAGEGLQQCTGNTQTADDGEPAEAAGEAKVSLQGLNVAGTATVTARVGSGPTTSITVVLSGDATNIALSLASASIPTGANAANQTYAIATVTDAAGNAVANVTPSFAVTAPGTGQVALDPGFDGDAGGSLTDCTTGTNAAGRCTVGVGNAPTAGLQTIRGRIVVNGANVDATAELRLAKALDTVEVAVGPVANGLATVSVKALDVDGNPAANAAAGAVVGAASAGAVVNCSGVVNGEATCTYVPPTTSQTVTVTAVVTIGSVTKQGSVQLPNTGGTPIGDGSFSGDIAASGVSIVSFDGGSVADLGAAASAAGLTSVWVTIDGDMIGYIVGAPAFVNAAFNAAFPDGLAEGTLAIVVR